MAQACTFGSVKLALSVFAALMLALGAAMLGISIFLYLDEDSVYLAEEDVSGYDSGIIIFICMGVGAVMIIVSLVGLIGAINKNPAALYFFMAVLFLTMGLEIGAGITGFVWRDNVQGDLPLEMIKSMKKYENQDIKKAWDKIHEKYKCCGRMERSDWPAVAKPIPASCQSFTPGCYHDVEKNMKRTLEMGSAAMISLALFQMLVVCFTGLMLLKLSRGEGKHLRIYH